MDIIVGSRVHSILYGGRNGVVYAIHGTQSPETVRSIGGIVNTGGSAEYDIVFENGTEAHRLPECIIRGSQWTVLGQLVGPDVIAFMREFAASESARKKVEAEESARRFSNAVSALRNDPNYGHLKQTGTNSDGGKLVAANVRVELKKAFPGVKFRVISDYNSVRLSWIDGPTTEDVKNITRKYSGGSFDAMEDLYRYERSPFTEVFGSAEYIFENRGYSEATLRTAANIVSEQFGCEPFTVKSYSDGLGYIDCASHSHKRDVYEYLETRHSFEIPAAA